MRGSRASNPPPQLDGIIHRRVILYFDPRGWWRPVDCLIAGDGGADAGPASDAGEKADESAKVLPGFGSLAVHPRANAETGGGADCGSDQHVSQTLCFVARTDAHDLRAGDAHRVALHLQGNSLVRNPYKLPTLRAHIGFKDFDLLAGSYRTQVFPGRFGGGLRPAGLAAEEQRRNRQGLRPVQRGFVLGSTQKPATRAG